MHKTCKFTQYSIIFSVPDKNDHIGGHFILDNLQIFFHDLTKLTKRRLSPSKSCFLKAKMDIVFNNDCYKII